jgi:hypothetical protein
MLPYFLLFGLVMWMAMKRMRPQLLDNVSPKWGTRWQATFFLLATLIGFRHEVGGDWLTYLDHIEMIKGEPFADFWLHGDPAYALLNWVGANVFGGVYLSNLVSAFIFSWGLIAFCRAQPRPWLALLVAVPYLIVVVAMGYTRQSVAIGLAMLGLVALQNGSVLNFVLWIACAALFHKTAVVLIPLAIFSGSKHRLIMLPGIAIAGAVLYWLLLQESVEGLVAGYIEAEYQSSGAAIRVAMNALPATLFLVFRKKFPLNENSRKFWTWISLGALGFVVLLVATPSSTAVDRIALYWIPLQLFVWSRLPDALGTPGKRNKIWVYLAIFYSALVLFVWLFFATHSFAWLPYKFYPLEMLF